VQQIQVRRKWRPEPHHKVSKNLGLKGESEIIWHGGACARRQCPGPLHRVAAAVCARSEEAVATFGGPAAKICALIWVFSAISAVATPTAATASSERTQTAAAALWRGPGHCPRAQAPPCPKLAAYLPLQARSLKEHLCGLSSSIITRPPPAPIQNVYLLQVLILISIGQGGQSRGRISVCCDC
jgi:hypothetical protein